MPEFLFEILKALGALIFIYPTLAVFKHYLQSVENREMAEDIVKYHLPSLWKIIEKYKKDE